MNNLIGQTNYHSGRVAEDQVAKAYERNGYKILAKRWRSSCGEIDLILKNANGLVFCEVKKALNFAQALGNLRPRQQNRIRQAALEFLTGAPDGLDTDCRFDVATVNGFGQIETLENAF